MDSAARAGDTVWTAEAFLRTDQHEFGDAWRYELLDGRVIAHAAPSPDHGAILSGLSGSPRDPVTRGPGRLPSGSRKWRGTQTSATPYGPHSRRHNPLREPSPRRPRRGIAVGAEKLAGREPEAARPTGCRGHPRNRRALSGRSVGPHLLKRGYGHLVLRRHRRPGGDPEPKERRYRDPVVGGL